MTRRKHNGSKHIVVRPPEEGHYSRLRKDWTGKEFKYFKVVKHIGFNCFNKSVYLCEDIFGEQFAVCSQSICMKTFGTVFWVKSSLKKYDRLRRCYCNILKRCYTAGHASSPNYYSKGVKVCDEWLGQYGLENFIKWAVKNGYQDHLTIDKRDKLYSPETCQWLTLEENSRYTSATKLSFEKARAIRQAYRDFVGYDMEFCRQQALVYEVHPQTIKSVILNIQWIEVN